ncbi:NADPH-dependent F420 reductase [Microlunatus flavus]|uniref:Pyrroline-5-carboxylate reductase catalytic N-terminal domain-containing protein n=1 Tax=Microlunatus flavus TaxID=1036181 RepID=A0A1H9N4W9_9ACTN|nr:NAD(P)-binding domain-containing protein [Microlunatus flavus]SER30928.1 hypothetical protein SAMN05421756_11297 [Microlunatus flavus]
MSVVAVVGAGKLGSALARRAVAAGHRVRLAGRDDSPAFRARVAAQVPGAVARTLEDAVDGADLVVLALPLAAHRQLDPAVLAGHVVVDAMNDWPSGGPSAADASRTSSTRVQRHLPGARVVKALNHVGYHDLDDEPLVGASPRRALAVAGDDRSAVRTVAAFVDSLGFQAVDAGPLARGSAFALGTPVFDGALDARALRRLVARPAADRSRALVAA